MRVVFMGTPDFAAASLKKILDDGFDVVGVFTQPDKPKGRGMELTVLLSRNLPFRIRFLFFNRRKCVTEQRWRSFGI